MRYLNATERRWLFFILKLAIALGALLILFAYNRINIDVLDKGLENRWLLLLAFFMMLPPFAIVALRLRIILRNQNIGSSFGQSLHWVMTGAFFDLVMPSGTGGDIVKASYIVKFVGEGKRTAAVMAVVFDRIFGLCGLFCLGLCALVIGWDTVKELPNYILLSLFLVGGSLVPVGAFLILGMPCIADSLRIQKILNRNAFTRKILVILMCFRDIHAEKVLLAKVLLLSAINHLFSCASIFCIAMAFSEPVTVLQALTLFPLAIFGNMFGVAGGFGLGTIGFDLLFQYFLNSGNGAVIGLTFQTLGALARLTGLPFYCRPSRGK